MVYFLFLEIISNCLLSAVRALRSVYLFCILHSYLNLIDLLVGFISQNICNINPLSLKWMQSTKKLNSFLASGDFCHLLIRAERSFWKVNIKNAADANKNMDLSNMQIVKQPHHRTKTRHVRPLKKADYPARFALFDQSIRYSKDPPESLGGEQIFSGAQSDQSLCHFCCFPEEIILLNNQVTKSG